jgi:CheY-like chemotaxis protein
MFRILIVEDVQDTLFQLKTLFSQVFPDSKIEIAGSVDDGLDCIRKAFEANWGYHAVVLDFMLPRGPGENPEPDESLCQEIRGTMPEAFVVHITAHPDDRTVLQHMYEIHRDHRDPQGELISKLETSWSTTLITQMKAYLYGTSIEAQMDALFGGAGRQTHGRHNSGRCLTHELAALTGDIVAHWDDLDMQIQQRIMATFRVDTSTHPIRISLL